MVLVVLVVLGSWWCWGQVLHYDIWALHGLSVRLTVAY